MEGTAAQPASLPSQSMAILRQLADPSSGMWQACGYQPFPLGTPTARRDPARPVAVAFGEVRDRYDAGYHNNAIAVGGGSRLFGAQAWRFHPPAGSRPARAASRWEGAAEIGSVRVLAGHR
jgi:hypothetical protein